MARDPLRYFRVEARELVDQLGQGVLDLEQTPSSELVARLLRAAHTLKGAARVVRQGEIADAAHAVEELLVPYRSNAEPVPGDAVRALLGLVDAMNADIAALGAPETALAEEQPHPAELGDRAPPAEPAAIGAADPPPTVEPRPARPAPQPNPAQPNPAQPNPAQPSPAHVSSPHLSPPQAIEPTPNPQALEPTPNPQALEPTPNPPAPAEPNDVDELLDAIGETHARFTALRTRTGAIDRIASVADLLAERLRRAAAYAAPDGVADTDPGHAMSVRLAHEVASLRRLLTDAVEQVERELDEVRGRAERLRLVCASTIFTSLHRAVRDAADVPGKRVAFEGRGGELRLDPHVLSQVNAALLHVVRNAVAHGIEAEAERLAAGKPAHGQVVVTVERRGQHASFCCTDDGRGFDLAALARAAQAAGHISPEDPAPTPQALLDLVMRGGITTAERVTGVSGRAIGLDVVRDVATQLGGTTEVRTEPGTGTAVELIVPLSLVALHGLVVQAAGVTASVPLDAVRRCLRLTPQELADATAAAALAHDGQTIPFIPLGRPLGQPTQPTGVGAVAVVLTADAGVAAVGVDRLLGTSTLVVRPLPELAPADPIVAGVCADAEGHPRLVLDPHALVIRALGMPVASGQTSGTEKAVPGDPVLVVDDSLTTRMLERSILESAGYQVDLAASGEEGLEKAGQRQYALFLVDIDMPGIDGFTFVERTRSDPALQGTPAILVSSRSSTEDRRRGVDVGASAYIVKTEFNQQELLDHVTRLVRQ